MTRHPPDILITTPESLYLMLTSRAREIFTDVEAGDRRRDPRRRADQARAHGGRRSSGSSRPPTGPSSGSACPRRRTRSRRSAASWSARSARADRRRGVRKPLDQDPRARRADGRARSSPTSSSTRSPARRRRASRSGPRSTPRSSSCPRAQVDDRVRQQPPRRRAAGAAAQRARLHEDLDGPAVEIARAHHGSLAREERLVIEDQLKAGELPCLVATSSLELGIDMGAVDLVLQVESPRPVTRGLRGSAAPATTSATPKGRIFPSSAPTCSSARSSRSGCAWA